MQQQPSSLSGLLQSNRQAGEYYSSLPGYVREMIRQREGNIRTEDDLRRYAENILQGDK